MKPAALIRAVGHRLATVHLCDYAPQGLRHLPPGTGSLTSPGLLRALPTAGYGESLGVEVAHGDDPGVLSVTHNSIRLGWEHVVARAD